MIVKKLELEDAQEQSGVLGTKALPAGVLDLLRLLSFFRFFGVDHDRN
jgi:hypothetical protein